MEGFLMKRGKEDSRYHPRKFVLCEAEDTLKYHVKENKVGWVLDNSSLDCFFFYRMSCTVYLFIFFF